MTLAPFALSSMPYTILGPYQFNSISFKINYCLHFQINKVFLGSDAHGSGRGIYVEEIEVQSTGEDPVIFPCRCWLAEDEGDGKTARVLTPGETIHPQLDSK